jgi:uncharacterized membrane protein YqhA
MIRFYKLTQWFIRIIAGLFFVVAIGFILLALALMVKSVAIFLFADPNDNWLGLAGISLLKTADILLMAVVFIIFSIGILMLSADPAEEGKTNQLPKWMRVSSFAELKISLWEAILTALLISFVAAVVKYNQANNAGVPYALLIIPVSILILALSIYFMKKGNHH